MPFKLVILSMQFDESDSFLERILKKDAQAQNSSHYLQIIILGESFGGRYVSLAVD